MEKITIVINEKNCMGCHACEIACKQEHGLGLGSRLIRVIENSPDFIPIYCHHCVEASCQACCPIDAISTNAQGIVLINSNLCSGCKECIEVCPFNAMQFDEVRKIAIKCDLCIDRLAENKPPACISVCPTNCIHLATTKNML